MELKIFNSNDGLLRKSDFFIMEKKKIPFTFFYTICLFLERTQNNFTELLI